MSVGLNSVTQSCRKGWELQRHSGFVRPVNVLLQWREESGRWAAASGACCSAWAGSALPASLVLPDLDRAAHSVSIVSSSHIVEHVQVLRPDASCRHRSPLFEDDPRKGAEDFHTGVRLLFFFFSI